MSNNSYAGYYKIEKPFTEKVENEFIIRYCVFRYEN